MAAINAAGRGHLILSSDCTRRGRTHRITTTLRCAILYRSGEGPGGGAQDSKEKEKKKGTNLMENPPDFGVA